MKAEAKIAPIGFKYDFSSKEGGGSYTVTGHINCERCEALFILDTSGVGTVDYINQT